MTAANTTSAVVAQPPLAVGTEKNNISADRHGPEARKMLWRAGRP